MEVLFELQADNIGKRQCDTVDELVQPVKVSRLLVMPHNRARQLVAYSNNVFRPLCVKQRGQNESYRQSRLLYLSINPECDFDDWKIIPYRRSDYIKLAAYVQHKDALVSLQQGAA